MNNFVLTQINNLRPRHVMEYNIRIGNTIYALLGRQDVPNDPNMTLLLLSHGQNTGFVPFPIHAWINARRNNNNTSILSSLVTPSLRQPRRPRVSNESYTSKRRSLNKKR